MKIDYLGARTNLDLPTSPGNARNGLLGGNCTKRAIPKVWTKRGLPRTMMKVDDTIDDGVEMKEWQLSVTVCHLSPHKY